jgi:hypothetical protein
MNIFRCLDHPTLTLPTGGGEIPTTYHTEDESEYRSQLGLIIEVIERKNPDLLKRVPQEIGAIGWLRGYVRASRRGRLVS